MFKGHKEVLDEYHATKSTYSIWHAKWTNARNEVASVNRETKKKNQEQKLEKIAKNKKYRSEQSVKITDLTELDDEGNEETAK